MCHALSPLWPHSDQGEEEPKVWPLCLQGIYVRCHWHCACTLTKHTKHLSAHLAQGLLLCNVLHVLLPVKQPEGQWSREPINFHKITAAIIVSQGKDYLLVE